MVNDKSELIVKYLFTKRDFSCFTWDLAMQFYGHKNYLNKQTLVHLEFQYQLKLAERNSIVLYIMTLATLKFRTIKIKLAI